MVSNIRSQYRFIAGSLDDLDHLPHMCDPPARINGQSRTAQFGDQMFSVGDAERKRAYKAAVKLAANDNVRLYRTQSLKPRLRF